MLNVRDGTVELFLKSRQVLRLTSPDVIMGLDKVETLCEKLEERGVLAYVVR